jgi:hypothetical protein
MMASSSDDAITIYWHPLQLAVENLNPQGNVLNLIVRIPRGTAGNARVPEFMPNA